MKTLLLLVATALVPIGLAQTPNPGDMQAVFAAAQAAATRPGDDALTCDALQDQLVANVNDPAVQGYVEKSGIAAQQKQEAVEGAGSPDGGGSSMKARVAVQTALTLATAMVPGAGMAGFMAQAGQMQAKQVEAAKNLADRMRQMNDMLAIMPQLMRGQRLIELAQARHCDWMPATPK